MLKKFLIVTFLLVIVIILAVAAFIFRKSPGKTGDQSVTSGGSSPFQISPKTSPNPTFDPNKNLTSNDFTAEWIIVRDPKKIVLIPNLADKLSSAEALKKYGCIQLVSGGFYSQENKYLGLLISDGKLVERSIKSSLFNGFFYIGNDEKFDITDIEPDNSVLKTAIQSGPILIKNSLPQSLSIENDEYARRVVAATTQKGEIAFLLIYYKPSPLIGPKLEELPDLLDKIQSGTNLKFKNALNLDGGSHSALISDTVRVPEVAIPGSYFCIKP